MVEDFVEEGIVVRRLQIEVERIGGGGQADWNTILVKMSQQPLSTCVNRNWLQRHIECSSSTRSLACSSTHPVTRLLCLQSCGSNQDRDKAEHLLVSYA